MYHATTQPDLIHNSLFSSHMNLFVLTIALTFHTPFFMGACNLEWRAAAPETFFSGSHVDPGYVYEIPLLGGTNFALKAPPPNRTFGYISVTESSPAYNWPPHMVKVMADRKAKELKHSLAAEKKKKEEEKGKGGEKGNGEGKDGKGSAPAQLDPRPSSSSGYRGRSRARSQKRNTSQDRARKLARDASAFKQPFGVL